MAAAPPGWYGDPTAAEQLRYWDGTTWTDHTSPAPAPAGPVDSGRVRGLGLLLLLLGAGSAVVFFLLSVATANSCGAFADGCDDYGEPAPSFALFASVTTASALVAAVGVVLIVMSFVRRDRHG